MSLMKRILLKIDSPTPREVAKFITVSNKNPIELIESRDGVPYFIDNSRKPVERALILDNYSSGRKTILISAGLNIEDKVMDGKIGGYEIVSSTKLPDGTQKVDFRFYNFRQ